MTRYISVSHIRWEFYEAMEADDKDCMANMFESLYHHYQQRGKLLKKLRVKS